MFLQKDAIASQLTRNTSLSFYFNKQLTFNKLLSLQNKDECELYDYNLFTKHNKRK